jgi:hypothetical protein
MRGSVGLLRRRIQERAEIHDIGGRRRPDSGKCLISRRGHGQTVRRSSRQRERNRQQKFQPRLK